MDLGKNLLLALLATTVFLGSMEAVSLFIRSVSLPEPVYSRDLEPDYLLFFRLRSGRTDWGDVNSLHLRGPEVPEKPQDEFRILSLGESSTIGWKVSHRQTYSAFLERRLHTVGGRRVKVVNAGVPAYTSFQGFTYLRYRGLELDPDAVLVYFGANDFTSVAFRTDRSAPWRENSGLTDRELFEERRNPLVRLSSLLLEYSNLFRLVALRGQPVARVSSSPRARVPAEDRWQILNDFRDLCREQRIQLIVLVPWYREFEKHCFLLREFAAATGVPVVDLPEKLRDLPEPRVNYFIDRMHPNVNGHRAIGGAIAEELRALWDERDFHPAQESSLGQS